MTLIDPASRTMLLTNGHYRKELGEDDDHDPQPIVKLFTPDGAATWLLSAIDPDDQDIAFGLCDLGLGVPELGYVRLSELMQLRGGLGLPVERDLHFCPKMTISAYAALARLAGRIVA